MLIYFLVSCLVALNGLTAQVQKCGGILDAENGALEIEPSNSSCLWVIRLQDMTGIRLELEHFTHEAILVIPTQNTSKANLQSVWIVGPKNTYTFEGKILAILAPSRNRKASLSWSGLTKDNSGGTLNAKFVRNSEGLLQWQRTSDGTSRIFWAIEPEATGQFKWALRSDLWYCGCDKGAACQCNSFEVILVMPDGSISNINKIYEGSSLGSLKVQKNSKILVLLHMDSTVGAGSLEVTWQSDEEPLKRDIKGLITGTEGGLYVISLNSSDTIQVSLETVYGVAYDWNSKKMYWAEYKVGIIRANMDGSDFEHLIFDRYVVGVGIEPITRNLYYGSLARNSLRVCDNDGKKCSTIVSKSGRIYDVAFHPSKGFLFWSIQGTKIVRANLDGTNATEVAKGISYGISVDEGEDRLYTYRSEEIISYDLNGHDLRTLGNVSIVPNDVEMDGGTVYFSSMSPKALHSTTRQGTNPALVADFTSSARHIALFGKQISSPRSNPCEHAECAHLCILITAYSYRCVCQDGEILQENGISCGV